MVPSLSELLCFTLTCFVWYWFPVLCYQLFLLSFLPDQELFKGVSVLGFLMSSSHKALGASSGYGYFTGSLGERPHPPAPPPYHCAWDFWLLSCYCLLSPCLCCFFRLQLWFHSLLISSLLFCPVWNSLDPSLLKLWSQASPVFPHFSI